MRQFFFALALVVTACATPAARADPPDINYAERVGACVTAAAGDEAALNACQGVASQPCMDADGGTTLGMMMCVGDEGVAWERLMDGAVQRLLRTRPETADALTLSQERWSSYLEAECGYRVARWGEGSGARVELVSCTAHMTADRAIALILIEHAPD